MNLELKRIAFAPKSTLGALYVDGRFECWILEDFVRPEGAAKVPGATAIPAGVYEVKITHSPRFGRPLPLVVGVPGFEGIRIHAGNTHRDTEGCLLPGTSAARGPSGEFEVVASFSALNALHAKIFSAPGRVFLSIS